jgi:hypothetical protein
MSQNSSSREAEIEGAESLNTVFDELDADKPDRAQKRLNVLRWVGLLDVVCLVALLIASLTGHRDIVRILGPIHGGVFLLLVGLAVIGAADKAWRWWFPVAIVLTGGPLGTLVGEFIISRQLKSKEAH